jgi:predicted KAP-like P-loop ATPase
MNQSGDYQEKPLIDVPITSSADDRLERAHSAHSFAKSIRELDASQGLVVSILGPWGSGKSSFINLMREQFNDKPVLTVVDFNPWMFSGSNQLVNFFFTEISAELNIRGNNRFIETAKWLNQYAAILKPAVQFVPIPGVAAATEIVSAAAGAVVKTADDGCSAIKVREKITEQLASLEYPIVVVLDDIDRLTTIEIREVFKLVRLTANFPNIIYLLAFDRKRVEKALNEDGIPGRAYLEKIVQLSFDIPQVSKPILHSQIIEELNKIIEPVIDDTFDTDRWTDVYWELINPMFSNMRDVTRYALSARSTIRSLGEEIDLVDLLAMEAVRVFRPELFQRLSQLRRELTNPSEGIDSKHEKDRQSIKELLDYFSDDSGMIRALFNRIFPAAMQYITNIRYGFDQTKTWRIAHRMAHMDFFDLYLDQVAPEDLVTFRYSEKAFALMNDREGFKEYLKGLDSGLLEDVIEGLTAYETDFTVDMVVPASTTLLNLIDAIPKRKAKSFLDISSPSTAVGRVVLRLLRVVVEESTREKMVSQIIEGTETYSSQLDLIQTVGYTEGVGHKLVSEEFATQKYENFVIQLQKKPPVNPSREWDAWRIYDVIQKKTGKASISSMDDPLLLKAVLCSLKSTVRAQAYGSRKVKLEDRLAWNLAVEIFGSENEIKKAVDSVRTAFGDDEILQLAERYLSGWKPEHL